METKDKQYFANKLYKLQLVDRALQARREKVYQDLSLIRDEMKKSLDAKEELLKELIDYKNGKSI